MDKYTVDLDQVLNDFEYSELTTEHNFDTKGNNLKQNPNTYVHNHFKNTNVKHSINNVFHSLNEYLNTEITPKVEINKIIEEPTVSGNFDNNDLESLSEENAQSNVNQATETEEETIEPCPSVHGTPPQEEEEEELIQTVTDKSLDNEVSNELINEEIASKEEPIINNQVINGVTSEKEAIVEEEEEELVHNEVSDEETNKVVTVGFDDTLDLDESELHQYLDELEKEFEDEKIKENPPVESTVEDQTELEDTISVRPNNLPLPNQEGGDETKPVIDLVGEPGHTPYNNVYISKELPEVTEDEVNKKSDSECSTSASPTFSDASTDTTSSCSQSTEENPKIATPPVKNEENPVNTSESDVIIMASEVSAITDRSEEGASSVANSQTPVTNTEAEAMGDWLGKQAPIWIPDAEAMSCLHCDQKFTVIKRRHHCRACGYVLCSKCCNLKHRLEYLDEVARVCNKCYDILTEKETTTGSNTSIVTNQQPNPNNPLEYCSTVPPLQQVSSSGANPPAVMVPVGVLKRKGSNKAKSNKSVMFCDGIRPGSDLTNLDNDFSYKEKKRIEESIKNHPNLDLETHSFIPKNDDLPPTVTVNKTDFFFSECSNGFNVVEMLKNETLMFALNTNLFVHLKIINMDCCINKTAWCFSTEGLINVGQDEIVIILEMLDDEKLVPKDIFIHINNIYMEAVKGTSVKEMGLSLHNTSNFLDSKNHAGFVYIRPTFQCLQNIIKPKEPYLIGILIHRWETPWAKLFPLRLILRLGAEYRYYPCPIISNRHRDSVFVEIGHTIINLLADFRNFSYTLPQIRGLSIHMEDKNTTVTIPTNRYDQVMKSMNNSSDHILAFAGNFSSKADSHLVCIQDTQTNENAYSTHAINIHDKPRKVTGASFIVFNGALKSSSGLTAKSSIVEDGLMIQITSDHMTQIRESLRNMKNHTIQCGCINAASDEVVNIVWGEPDTCFNINVFSPIDNKPMEGIPSIRVHNGKDYVNGNHLIRWTEVFIVQNEGEASRNQDPIDISKVSETIAKATCTALVKYLTLLISNNFYKIGIRANINTLFVAYCAGSNGTKLPPIYMESLDNELVPVLHRNVTSDSDENTILLELIFRILNK